MASAQVDSFGKDMLDNTPNYMFKFKGEVHIPLLWQVDDLLGVAKAGFKSELLHAFVNVKTDKKDLQFGREKCTYIMVSKMKPQFCHRTELFDDSWKLRHLANGNFEEIWKGKVVMNQENALPWPWAF